MSVRLRRLYAEHERLKVLFADHERIRIVEALGDPPDRYVVEYKVKGLVDNKGVIEESCLHRIRITLGPNYPNEMASYVAITPIFHPNIDYLAVCTADKDAASTKIEDNIVFIGRLITFQDYNLQSPRNGDAARWTAANLSRLPLERVNLWPRKALEGAALPAMQPDQIPARSQAPHPEEQHSCANCGRNDAEAGLRECSSHHLACRDCAVNCANCRQFLCVLCAVQVCSECRAQICADCATTCAKCQRTVCPVHATQCVLCGAIRCGGCSGACAGCGGLFCGDHLDGTGRCPACSKGTDGVPSVQPVGDAGGISLGVSAAQSPFGSVELGSQVQARPDLCEAYPASPPSRPPGMTTPVVAQVPAPPTSPPSAVWDQARVLAPPPLLPVATPVRSAAPTLPPRMPTPMPPTLVAPVSAAAVPPVPPAPQMVPGPPPARLSAFQPQHLAPPPVPDALPVRANRAASAPSQPPERVVPSSLWPVLPASPPLVHQSLSAGENLVRSSPRLVITAEEALRVPQSALLGPDARLQISPATAPPISGKAIASLAFGILGLPVVGLLVGWFAVWFGIMAIRQIDRTERLRGRGMAIVGMTLGIASIVLWVILVAAYGPSLFTSRFGNVPGEPVRF
jgi:ubiquitin-protein ligase